MSHFIISSDNINGNEESYKNHLLERIEQAGHTGEIISTGPNAIQHYGLSSGDGAIGIQIIGGLCGFTASDLVTGIRKGYYHFESAAFVGSSEFSGYSTLTTEAMTKYQMQVPHDAPSGALDDMYVGKTPSAFNQEYGEWMRICLGDTFDEAIDVLLGQQEKTTDKSTTKSYKEIIMDLTSEWAGDVLVYSRDNKLYVNKIPLPETATRKLQEGVNIVSDSVKITDIHPETKNKVTVTYDENELTIHDDLLVRRFGEKEDKIKNAVKYVKPEPEEEGQEVASVEEPITNHTDALAFAINELYKFKVDDGREIELDVIGRHGFVEGEWIELYLPALKETTYMFVSSVSNKLGVNDEFITSINLRDAPPILKEKEEEDKKQQQPNNGDNNQTGTDLPPMNMEVPL